jgi:hypothetical protein
MRGPVVFLGGGTTASRRTGATLAIWFRAAPVDANPGGASCAVAMSSARRSMDISATNPAPKIKFVQIAGFAWPRAGFTA